MNEILGSSNTELITLFIERILSGDSGEVLRITESLSNLGKSMGVLTKDLTGLLRDLLIVKTCKTANAILGLPENRFKELKAISDGVSEARIIRVLEIFAETENSLRYTTHPRVVFETAAVKAAHPETDYDIDALLARIKALEDRLQSGATLKVEKSQPIAEEKAAVKPAENLTAEEIKGRLLSNLRKIGSEMLWNAMQNIGLTAEKGEVTLIPKTTDDYALITMDLNREKIESALKEAGFSAVVVKEPKNEQKLSEIDDATERLKKIFGEDIVIVKH